MTLTEKIDRGFALAIDTVSFAFINVLQRRHKLPPNLLEVWEKYSSFWSQRTPEEYFAIPANYARPKFPGTGRWNFPSPITSDFAENNLAGFDLYPCAQGWSAPTMIIAHGLMSVSDVGYRRWAKRLNEKGWNAVFMHLPFHYSRRLPGHLQGELIISADLIRTAESIRQGVIDTRVLIEAIEEQGGKLFGGWGTSYGGLIMALAACTEPLFKRLILVEPILDIHNAIWDCPAAVTLRSTLRKAGITQNHTQSHLRFCCPTHHRPYPQGKHVLLLAGEYDRVAAPEQIQNLHQNWTGSIYRSLKQGHIGYTLMPASFQLAQEHWPEDFPNELNNPLVYSS